MFCCAFNQNQKLARVKRLKSTIPRYQVIVDCETLLPSPSRETIRTQDIEKKWRYENGNFCSKLSGLVLAVRENGEVYVWSKKPFDNESQRWLLTKDGHLLHIQSGLVLDISEDGQSVRLVEKDPDTLPTSTSLPSSTSHMESEHNSSEDGSTSCSDFDEVEGFSEGDVPRGVNPSVSQRSLLSSRRWRLTSKGYLLNLATRKVLCPAENKVGSKVVLRGKSKRPSVRSRSYSLDEARLEFNRLRPQVEASV